MEGYRTLLLVGYFHTALREIVTRFAQSRRRTLWKIPRLADFMSSLYHQGCLMYSSRSGDMSEDKTKVALLRITNLFTSHWRCRIRW